MLVKSKTKSKNGKKIENRITNILQIVVAPPANHRNILSIHTHTITPTPIHTYTRTHLYTEKQSKALAIGSGRITHHSSDIYSFPHRVYRCYRRKTSKAPLPVHTKPNRNTKIFIVLDIFSWNSPYFYLESRGAVWSGPPTKNSFRVCCSPFVCVCVC